MEDYVSEWTELDGLNVGKLLHIYKTLLTFKEAANV